MPTYLLKWDATRWDWRNLTEQAEAVKNGLPVTRTWTCGTARRIAPDDRVFIIRLGREPRGIIAAGRVTRGSYESPGLEQQDGSRQRGSMHIDLRFDGLQEPRREACIPRTLLSQGVLASFLWDIPASGVQIPDPVAAELEKIWAERIEGVPATPQAVSADVEAARAREAAEAEREANAAAVAAAKEAAASAAVAQIAARKAAEAKALADKAAADKAAAAKAAADRLAAQQAAVEKAKADKLAAERAAAEKVAAEKAAAAKRAAEREAAAKAAAAKAEADKRAAVEKAAADKAAAQRSVTDQATLDKIAAYQAAAAQTAAEKAEEAQRQTAERKVREQARPAAPLASAPRPAMYPAIVADHFAMLAAELTGALYSKADHRARLAQQLGLEDADSIDVAHQQIGAVLLQLGLPAIDGFRPLGGCPETLRHAVHDWIEAHADAVEQLWLGGDASKVPVPVELDDARSFHMSTPARGDLDEAPSDVWLPKDALDLDFGGREALDERLAMAGQRFVLAFERARLRETGHKDLIGRIEWVAQDRGDALGFQIRSFDESGGERLIIVKTTNYGARFPFTLSAHELAVAREHGAHCCLYRVFSFSRGAKLWLLEGPLDQKLGLAPSHFRAVL